MNEEMRMNLGWNSNAKNVQTHRSKKFGIVKNILPGTIHFYNGRKENWPIFGTNWQLYDVDGQKIDETMFSGNLLWQELAKMGKEGGGNSWQSTGWIIGTKLAIVLGLLMVEVWWQKLVNGMEEYDVWSFFLDDLMDRNWPNFHLNFDEFVKANSMAPNSLLNILARKFA